MQKNEAYCQISGANKKSPVNTGLIIQRIRESRGIIFLWCVGLQVYCNYQACQYRNEKDDFLSGFSFMCPDFEVGLLCCNRGDISSVLHKMCFLFFVVCVFLF